MIVSDFLACPLAIHSTDFGIIEDVDVVQDRRGQRHRLAALQHPDPRLRRPGEDQDAGGHAQRGGHGIPLPGDVPTSTTASCRSGKSGQTHIWFTPWDYLIRWWGIEEAMIDLVERPDLVHAGVERMVDAWMVELDQFVALNVLSLDCNNTRIGSGGYGYTRASARHASSIRARAAAQHVGLLQRPDLLRGLAADALGVRPEARSALAGALGPDLLRLLRAAGPEDRHPAADSQPAQDLRQPLVQHASGWSRRSAPTTSSAASPARRSWPRTHGTRSAPGRIWSSFLEEAGERCHVELIMKDISTVRYQPQRLWEWAAIAMEVAEEFAR